MNTQRKYIINKLFELKDWTEKKNLHDNELPSLSLTNKLM